MQSELIGRACTSPTVFIEVILKKSLLLERLQFGILHVLTGRVLRKLHYKDEIPHWALGGMWRTKEYWFIQNGCDTFMSFHLRAYRPRLLYWWLLHPECLLDLWLTVLHLMFTPRGKTTTGVVNLANGAKSSSSFGTADLFREQDGKGILSISKSSNEKQYLVGNFRATSRIVQCDQSQ